MIVKLIAGMRYNTATAVTVHNNKTKYINLFEEEISKAFKYYWKAYVLEKYGERAYHHTPEGIFALGTIADSRYKDRWYDIQSVRLYEKAIQISQSSLFAVIFMTTFDIWSANVGR